MARLFTGICFVLIYSACGMAGTVSEPKIESVNVGADVSTITVAVGHARTLRSFDISPDGARILYVACSVTNCQGGSQRLQVIDVEGRLIASIADVKEWRAPQFLDDSTIYAAHPCSRLAVARIKNDGPEYETGFHAVPVGEPFVLGTLAGRDVYATYAAFGLRWDHQSILAPKGFIFVIRDLADGSELYRAQYPIRGALQWLRIGAEGLWFDAAAGRHEARDMAAHYSVFDVSSASDIGRGVQKLVAMIPLHPQADSGREDMFAHLARFKEQMDDPRYKRFNGNVHISDIGPEVALLYVVDKGHYRLKGGSIAPLPVVGFGSAVISRNGNVVAILSDRWGREAPLGDTITILKFSPSATNAY